MLQQDSEGGGAPAVGLLPVECHAVPSDLRPRDGGEQSLAGRQQEGGDHRGLFHLRQGDHRQEDRHPAGLPHLGHVVGRPPAAEIGQESNDLQSGHLHSPRRQEIRTAEAEVAGQEARQGDELARLDGRRHRRRRLSLQEESIAATFYSNKMSL